MKIEFVTTLKRQATKILAELTQERMCILEGIARGETAILENCTFTHAEAKEKMSKWLK